jgi:cold shock CspA family protein
VKGKICKYLSFRGYGFIKVNEHEKDIFFHVSSFPPAQVPSQYQDIEFDIIETLKGPEAINIKILEKLSIEKFAHESKNYKKEIADSEENDLKRVKGVGTKYKLLLKKAQVKTCQELADCTLNELLTNILIINEKEQITKRPPSLTQVKDWIEHARMLS